MGRCDRDVSDQVMTILASLNPIVHRPREHGAIFFLLEHLCRRLNHSRYYFPALDSFRSADLLAYIAS